MLGGGCVAVLQGGNIFEKAGCNTSVIHGMMPIDRLHNMRADHQNLHQVLSTLTEEEKQKGLPFSVAGISLVFHPHNPHQPTVHANYRMFQIHPNRKASNLNPTNQDEGDDSIYWFGGGSDLTPTYIESSGENSQYGKHFHNVLKTVLNQKQAELGVELKFSNNKRGDFNNFYDFTKSWCDEYFYLPHRNETRGLGGIFYDDFDFHSTGLSQNQMFDFVTTLGDSFASSYFPLIVANSQKTFTPEQKQFQQLRRGRYVEFNVMYDRGTKFGLQMPSTAAIRVEQILMSLPLTARYEYCHSPEVGSPEANTLEILRKPISWAD
jgi:coproporphyrinogen III oxidase